jgi:outer membrane protein
MLKLMRSRVLDRCAFFKRTLAARLNEKTMKTFITLILFSIVLSSPGFAEEEVTETYTDTGVPAQDQQARPSDFHGILGAGLFSGQRIIGDDGRRTSLFPLVLIRYKDVAYWSLTGGGVWLVQTGDHSVRFGGGVRIHAGWRQGDDPDLAGMETRKSSLDGYLNALWRTSLVTIGAHYYHDILNANRGDAASLRLSKNFKPGADVRLTPSLGAEWQNSERVNYYFGVRPEEVLAFRPAYTGTATINASAGLAGDYRLSRSWSLLGGVFTTRFGKGIVDSPIVTRRYSTLVYLGAGWRF